MTSKSSQQHKCAATHHIGTRIEDIGTITDYAQPALPNDTNGSFVALSILSITGTVDCRSVDPAYLVRLAIRLKTMSFEI
jgi:hypothetical protein